MSSPAPARTAVLDYNPGWMDKTFKSQARVEALLGPELGINLSRKDYDTVLRVFSGPRYTDFFGVGAGIAAMTLPPVVLKRRVSIPLGLAAYTVGSVAGAVSRHFTHIQVLRGLENPHGFARALESVKRKVPYTPGLIGFSRKLPPAEEEERLPFSELEPDLPPVEGFAGQRTKIPNPPPPTVPGKSRWDELRAARRVAEASVWDNIRAGKRADGGATTTQSPAKPDATEYNSATPYRDEDRIAAQAEFDALVERERRMQTRS
ncbi:hypothetical protein MKEN_01293000 [Mycena kentingensis (nom. inval.)]|nr:hypothetical protein MKEN_01293000 [Mycena kentingensis (nom. inval.)]